MSIEKTDQGTYRVRWRDATGKQCSRTWRTKADAKAFEADTLADLRRGTYVDTRGTRITLTSWADDWLRGAMNLAPGGRETYRRDLDRHILPVLGHLPLAKITDTAIDDFLADELAGHRPHANNRKLAPSTVLRHYRTLRRMLQVAVHKHLLTANPCDSVTPPAPDPGEMRFLTATALDSLATGIGGRYEAWALVAGWGGLRWSETVGLRRSAIDGARITVNEQLIRRADGRWERCPPKSKAGRRVVTVPSSVADVLATHLDKWAAPGPDGLVFPNRLGNPLNGPSFRGSVFARGLRTAEIPTPFRVHDLRHTAVALAIAAGAHPKTIQMRMGHASISVTLDRYGHLFPEIDGELAGALEALRSPGVAA